MRRLTEIYAAFLAGGLLVLGGLYWYYRKMAADATD